MFKKFSSGILIIILAVLMIVYLIVRYSNSDERTFRDKILSFDAATITKIMIHDPKSGQEAVDLRLSGENWIVRDNGKEYTADTNVVKNMLKQLSELPTKRYAGKGNDAWIKYEVTDTSAALVTLFASEKTVAEIYIGKFSYNMPKEQQQMAQARQQRGDMTSYVRLKNEEDVYAVDGYLKMSFNGKTATYRLKSLTSVNPADITHLIINQPGNKKVLDKQGGKWFMNGIPADSAMVAKYCSSIARLSSSKFVGNEVSQSFPGHSVRIEGNNFSPVDLQAYPVADTNVAYIISSSANPGAFFNGKEGGLFKKIWESGL